MTKTCDKNLAEKKAPEQLCDKAATVTSSRELRHRCGAHCEGPGWVVLKETKEEVP